MPGRRRAPVKRPRAQKTARRAEPFPILLIEQPLTDAINFAQALYLMGFGLISHHEAGGDAIVALAHETGKRLEAVKGI
jgi:ABC-type branched-subunit amino acid transport system ATPase component